MNETSQVTAAVDISKTTFLVVDDKAFYRDMAHTALTRAKAKNIEHASDVDNATKIIARLGRRIGCIICDWDMAPSGGLNLLQMIRSGALPTIPPNTPFIILTGRADSDAIKAAMALDVSGVAIAPLSFDKLIKTIFNAIARTWTLKPKEHYVATHLVQSTKTAPPPGSASGSAHPRSTILKEGSSAPQSGSHRVGTDTSTGPTRETKTPEEPELRMIRMSNLARVEPGDIIARDLKDKDGKMLLCVGTELTVHIIARLKEHSDGHPDSYHLWVGEWEK
jgi:DNA-binding NarL/FixJ family response regulator